MSKKNALIMLRSMEFATHDKQLLLTQLYPVIEILLFGVLSRKRINNQQKVEEIRSDVYLHLWQLILRNKIDFTRDPHQLLVFLMMDVTLTVGRYFQKKIVHTEEIDPETPWRQCKQIEIECKIDSNNISDNVEQEFVVWSRRYQQLLKNELTTRMKLVLKRRAMYKMYSLYREG